MLGNDLACFGREKDHLGHLTVCYFIRSEYQFNNGREAFDVDSQTDGHTCMYRQITDNIMYFSSYPFI